MAAILSPRTVGDETTISDSLVTREGAGEASTVMTFRGDSRMTLGLPRELHDEWFDPERPAEPTLSRRPSRSRR